MESRKKTPTKTATQKKKEKNKMKNFCQRLSFHSRFLCTWFGVFARKLCSNSSTRKRKKTGHKIRQAAKQQKGTKNNEKKVRNREKSKRRENEMAKNGKKQNLHTEGKNNQNDRTKKLS